MPLVPIQVVSSTYNILAKHLDEVEKAVKTAEVSQEKDMLLVAKRAYTQIKERLVQEMELLPELNKAYLSLYLSILKGQFSYPSGIVVDLNHWVKNPRQMSDKDYVWYDFCIGNIKSLSEFYQATSN